MKKINHSFFLTTILAVFFVLAMLFAGSIFVQAEYDEKEVHKEEVTKESVENKDHETVKKEGQSSVDLNKKDTTQDVAVKTIKRTSEPTVKIDSNGSITITNGEVVSASWPNITVEAWGINFSVNIPQSASIQGVADALEGDKVSLSGQIANGDITASSFTNHSQKEREQDEIRKQIEALLKQVEALQLQLKNL